MGHSDIGLQAMFTIHAWVRGHNDR